MPVTRALKDTFIYHLGTILLTVIITPIFSVPRNIIGPFKYFLKKANQKNSFVKFTISALMCCFVIYDNFLRYLTYNCYIQTAMWSLNHKKASRKAYFLVNRHQKDIRNIEFLQKFVILQTKVKK